jgi:HSP20 family protein
MAEEKKNGAVAVQEKRALGPFQMFEQEMAEMRRRMHDLFRRPFAEPPQPLFTATAAWAPTADAFVKDGELVVKAELPGVKKEDITVELAGGLLTIAGNRAEEKETREAKYYVSERFSGSFERSFAMPDGVNADAITATFKDGVLEVRVPLPASAEAKPTSIPVKS